MRVSTHSRPRAAGLSLGGIFGSTISFNTQPPEGGWIHILTSTGHARRFNTQPPEGGWFSTPQMLLSKSKFQHTAARGRLVSNMLTLLRVQWFQHTAARGRLGNVFAVRRCQGRVSTHSRPRAAGSKYKQHSTKLLLFQHTAARGRLDTGALDQVMPLAFQHTAARGRLARIDCELI